MRPVRTYTHEESEGVQPVEPVSLSNGSLLAIDTKVFKHKSGQTPKSIEGTYPNRSDLIWWTENPAEQN